MSVMSILVNFLIVKICTFLIYLILKKLCLMNYKHILLSSYILVCILVCIVILEYWLFSKLQFTGNICKSISHTCINFINILPI